MHVAGRSGIGRHGASFVIRVWLEERNLPGPPEWRWHVQHVQSGEQMRCRFMADLLGFIERQTGVEPPRLTPEHDGTGQRPRTVRG
jgi:hypothetical protein